MRYILLLVLSAVLVACGGGGGSDITPQDVIDSFEAAGLEVGDYRPLVAEDYGLLPVIPEEGIRFFIPSLGDNAGGRVMLYEDEQERDAAKEYYDTLSENPLFASWTYTHGNILVQINGSLDEATAGEYEAALQAAGEN